MRATNPTLKRVTNPSQQSPRTRRSHRFSVARLMLPLHYRSLLLPIFLFLHLLTMHLVHH